MYKRLIILVLVAAVLAGCEFGREEPTPIPTVPPPAVEPGPNSRGGVVASGEIVAARDADLSFTVPGRVDEANVTVGDLVESGQMLLVLDSAGQAAAVAQAQAQLLRAQTAVAELEAGARLEEVASTQAAVEAAQAQLARVVQGARPEELAAAQAAVEAAQAQLARVQQGARPDEIAAAEAGLAAAEATLQKVQEGPREEELVAARADVANAEAALAQAQAAYDLVKWDPQIQARSESLQLEQATNAYNAASARMEAIKKRSTKADIAAAQAGIDQARANLDALQVPARAADIAAARAGIDQAQAQLDALRAPARAADIAAAEAEIRRAQAQLQLLEAGARPETLAAVKADVAAAEAALEQAQVALTETGLRAPFAGTITALTVSLGETAQPGQVVLSLADLSDLQAETNDLSERDVDHVALGQKATVWVEALGQEIEGQVIAIAPQATVIGGDVVYAVKVELDEQPPGLRWGMSVDVEIDTE